MSERLFVDQLANEIRRVDGAHSLGAGALAEALLPFLTEHDRQVAERARVEFADELTRKGVHTFDIHSIRRAAKGEQK